MLGNPLAAVVNMVLPRLVTAPDRNPGMTLTKPEG